MTICVTDFTKRDPRSRFDKKLAAYALAGGAMLAMPDAASATMIQVTPGSPITLSVANGMGSDSVGLDLDADGIVDFMFGAHSFDAEVPGSFYNTVDVYGRCGCTNGVVKGSYSSYTYSAYAKAYPAPGTIPGSGADFVGTATLISGYTDPGGSVYVYPDSQWLPDGTPAFLGVRFDRNGTPAYGWIEVATRFGSADLQINSWAYDDAAVPEPSSMALFAAGAAGVAVLRRRKKRA